MGGHGGKHALPQSDALPSWARLALYMIAIVAPFAGLLAGRLTGEQTLAAVLTLFGAIGPAVAVIYNRKQADETGAYFRAGYAEAVDRRIVGTDQDDYHPGEQRPAETQKAGSHIPTKKDER